MKFWELISAFRSERSVFDAVFAEHSDHGFSAHYANFDTLVSAQNRDVLDSVVPQELLLLIASRSKQKFYLSADGTLRLAHPAMEVRILTALDVVERFGGSVIEEVHAFGSARTGRPQSTSERNLDERL